MSFEVNFDWPAERACGDRDVAAVRLRANDQIMTQLFDPEEGRVRDHFRTSAVKLAFWFGENWWRLRYEPITDERAPPIDWRLRHEMNSGSGGSVWPALMIYGVGSRVIVSPSVGRQAGVDSIRYLADRPVSVAAEAYEIGVDALFRAVLDSCAHHQDARALGALIERLRIERDDEGVAAWRRLEACLGFDPEQAPDQVINRLIALEDAVGEATIEEAAVAVQGIEAPIALERALDASRASHVVVDFAAMRDSDGLDLHHIAPWHAGQLAAEHLRRVLNLPEVVSWRDLGDMLATRSDQLAMAPATAYGMAYSTKIGDAADRAKLGLRFRPQADRRFEIGCFIGDDIWSRGHGVGIVAKSKTDRQKFQRAFAQSLFCPMGPLSEIVNLARPTEVQMDRAGRRFGVRPSVVKAMLTNRGYLPRETLADQLEAA
jgi:hypothetical protein